MRKFNIFAIFPAVLLLAAVSCTKDNLMEKDGSFISLKLSSKSLETKATKEGEDPFNENMINSVYYFFYKDGEESSAPVVQGRLKGLEHKSGVRTEEIPVTSGTAASLFGSSEECQTFIVANPPQGLEEFLGGSPTLNGLRAKLFQTSLDGIQDSFTMTFDDKVAKAATTGNIMTVEANLRRLANKFTVSLNISGDIGSPVKWQSVPADAKVEFHNAFKEAALGGDFAAVKAGDSEYKEKFFSTEAIGFGIPEQDGDDWKCKIVRPIYSYSVSWELLSATEPYIIIELPWINMDTEEVVPTYYKVFFSTKGITINNWYHLNVDLGRLGGFFKEDPVQIINGTDYTVLDWNEAFDDGYGIFTEIDDARYLMMDQTEYWIYGQNTWSFPYASSHDCEIVDETYEKKNYSHCNAETISGPCSELADFSLTHDGSLITVNHSLNKDLSSTKENGGIICGAYDVVPYTFKFRIRHKDNPSYFQDVTVHQYPAIYIEAQPNSAGVYLDKDAHPLPQSTAFVNIYDCDDGYGGDPQVLLINEGCIDNKNGNMYVITTTIAPVIDGNTCLLADPRQHTNMVYLDDTFILDFGDDVPALYGESPRTLKVYYPTKNSSDVEKIIAPKLRVASSWGQSGLMSYDKAVRRCAAYQEDGYPAGRWRVPTKAEVMYICKLSSDHVIPQLFGQFGNKGENLDVAAYYWCSTGFVGVYKVEEEDGTLLNAYHSPEYTSGPENDTQDMAVRCVYDEWYWENYDYNNGTVATEKGRLPEGLWGERYWGDMPR